MKHISILDIFYSIWQRKRLFLSCIILFFILSILYIFISKPIYNPTAIVKVSVYEINPKWASEIAWGGLVPSTPIDKVGTQVEIIKIITDDVLKDNGVNLIFEIPKRLVKVEMKRTIVDTIKKDLKYELKLRNDSIIVLKDKEVLCSGIFDEEINCKIFSFKLKKLNNFGNEIKASIIYKNYPKTIDEWMKNKIIINQEGITDLVKISVLDEDKYMATKLANDIANKYIDWTVEQERRIARISKNQLEELLKNFDLKLDSLKSIASRLRLDTLTLVSYLLEFKPSDEALAKLIEKLIANANDPYLKRVIERFYSKDIDFAKLNNTIVNYLLKRDTVLSSILDREIAISKTVSPSYIVSYASPPYKPILPKKGVTIFLSLFLGTLFGILLSLVYDILDRKIESIIQLKRYTHLENVQFFNNLNNLRLYIISKPNVKFHFNEKILDFRNYDKNEADEYVIVVRRGIDIYSYIELLNNYSNKKCNITLL